jgi:hypothetical protein
MTQTTVGAERDLREPACCEPVSSATEVELASRIGLTPLSVQEMGRLRTRPQIIPENTPVPGVSTMVLLASLSRPEVRELALALLRAGVFVSGA